jgi:Cobalamin-independent synthase, Catalytic domain
MTTHTHVGVARSDVVGSLLRPPYLREARQGVRQGRVSDAELHAAEDRAVREAIALQESAGLDVISDGELRRQSWVVTIPLREEGVPPMRRSRAMSFCQPSSGGGRSGRSLTAGAPRSGPPRLGRSLPSRCRSCGTLSLRSMRS